MGGTAEESEGEKQERTGQRREEKTERKSLTLRYRKERSQEKVRNTSTCRETQKHEDTVTQQERGQSQKQNK